MDREEHNGMLLDAGIKKDILVEADNLEYSYKDGAVLVPAVDQVSFQIRKERSLRWQDRPVPGKYAVIYVKWYLSSDGRDA